MSRVTVKHFFPLLIVLLALPLAAQEPTVHELFARANLYYQQGEFLKAIEAYDRIRETGLQSGELYYNMANAWYKLGKPGKARLYYERAMLWLEGDEDLKQNLELLKLQLVDKIEEPPQLFLSQWWAAILHLFPLNVWAYISLTLFWLTLFCAAAHIHYRRRGSNHMKNIFIAACVLWVLSLTIAGHRVYLFETEAYAIIQPASVTVYAEPAASATELFILHEGTKVRVDRHRNGWLEIELADGKSGWLEEKTVEII